MMPFRKGEESMTEKQKQWQLYFLGYYGGRIDGIWGPESAAAAVSFQKDNALDADSIFGAKTMEKSKEIIRAIAAKKQIPRMGICFVSDCD